jgi:hypothetical protein
MTKILYKGSCVCGKTSYEAYNLNDVSFCHCAQCRNMTGHHMAGCQADRDNIKIEGSVKWFYTHDKSRHGFCENCGSQMFWQNDNRPTITVTAGSLDDSKKLKVRHNIFIDEKGSYYEINPNEIQHIGYGNNQIADD